MLGSTLQAFTRGLVSMEFVLSIRIEKLWMRRATKRESLTKFSIQMRALVMSANSRLDLLLTFCNRCGTYYSTRKSPAPFILLQDKHTKKRTMAIGARFTGI